MAGCLTETAGAGVTPDNFHRLRVGMTEREVEAILGKPGEPVLYTTFGPDTFWSGEHCRVNVWFGRGGVACAELAGDDGLQEFLPDRDPSFWDHLRRWLPW
jgi:hypothetical protein